MKAMNVIARGISSPNTESGPESSQSTIVNDGIVTSAFTAPLGPIESE